ncbi:MAG: DUF1116 domain-containing protein [Candidatus Nanopelagicales bacterium]|nr:DUF1116 domain-containing protein [Candidatus Nanopelagicales bacterium]
MLGGVRVVAAGAALITDAVPEADLLRLDWRPPGSGDPDAARDLMTVTEPEVDAANARAMALVHAVRPQLLDVRPASDVVPGLVDHGLLHAGPPIAWSRMCGPMQGALIGATLFEGWAPDESAARALLGSGRITLSPCHDHATVGPMAGVVSPSMPVLVVGDGERRAFATLNEGLGKVLRFGAFDAEVLGRLAWLREVLGPVLSQALETGGPVDVTTLVAQALSMGDEGHNRNLASSSLLARRLAPELARLDDGAAALSFLAANDHFALNISMAAAKLSMDAAADVAHSSLVTVMCRNGVEFGIRTAGTGAQWFTAPVGPATGLYFSGFGPEHANPDLGDSSITETLGLGGFAMAAAPAITRFVGGTVADAIATTRSMRRITITEHPVYQLPGLGFVGTPSGIDARKVVETGVLPVINTGIAHLEAGVGQIGAGTVTAPAEVFSAAIAALAARERAEASR